MVVKEAEAAAVRYDRTSPLTFLLDQLRNAPRAHMWSKHPNIISLYLSKELTYKEFPNLTNIITNQPSELQREKESRNLTLNKYNKHITYTHKIIMFILPLDQLV